MVNIETPYHFNRSLLVNIEMRQGIIGIRQVNNRSRSVINAIRQAIKRPLPVIKRAFRSIITILLLIIYIFYIGNYS